MEAERVERVIRFEQTGEPTACGALWGVVKGKGKMLE